MTARLFDEKGESLYVQGCAKGRRRYRYYVSKALVRGDGDCTENGWRLSAPEIEQTVASVAVALLSDHHAIVAAAEHSNIDQSRLSSALNCAETLIERLQSVSESDSVLRELVERVQLSATAIRLSLAIRLPEQGGPATRYHLFDQRLSDADQASRRRNADGAGGRKRSGSI